MIDVLVATFHPDAKTLSAQIASIRAQRGVEAGIIVREDGSAKGPASNFSALLAESTAPYAAFSDQDDIWEPDKLSTLMGKMRELEALYGKETPLLVFSDASLVDAEGLPMGGGSFMARQGVDVHSGIAFPRLLMQNFIAGNLMLFNAALRERAGSIPDGAIMHDIWLALVASAFGRIGFVDRMLVRYRQHGSNAVGATVSSAAKQRARAKEGIAAFRARLSENISEAQAFVLRFGAEAPASAHALASFPSTGWFGRRLAIVRSGLWKHGPFRNLALLAFA